MAEQVTSAKATAKTVRIAARKVRLVVDLIRGKSVAEAIAILKFTLVVLHQSLKKFYFQQLQTLKTILT